MNSCPSAVSNLSIVLGGGRSLREVGCVDESASRSFGRVLGPSANLSIWREQQRLASNLQRLLGSQ
jgi:hypothetical protein